MDAAFYEDEQVSAAEKEISSRRALGKLIPLLHAHRRGLTICLLALILFTAMKVVWPILVRDAIDIAIGNSDWTKLLNYTLAIAGIQIVSLGLWYFQRFKLEVIGQDVMLNLKQKLFDHLLSLGVDFFDRNPVGRLMARVESDTESLRMLFTNTATMIIGDVLLIFGIYGVMFYYEWRLALILASFIPVTAIMIWVFQKVTTHRFYNLRKKMAEVTATLTEFLHGMSIVQIFHRGAWARYRVRQANWAKYAEDRDINVIVVLFFNTIFFVEYLKVGAVLLMGPLLGVDFGIMVMFIILIWQEFEPIFHTSEQLATIQKAIAGGRRIFALLLEEPNLREAEKPVQWDGLKETIRFENVSFSYTNDDNYALRNATFEVPVGKRIALAGVTGGGKSTIISLLLRLYDPQQGRITVDGIDIRDVPLANLRRAFALVLQDILLFPGNVKANITLESDEISDERMMAASRVVDVDRFVSRLPKGYETEVSEKGANFSRGERQLLSFARALVVDPDVLLLDEATSSVDPETEKVIQSSLDTLMKGRTSIVIAHRLATILDSDQILVIRRGEIVERGTHTELILQDGYYSKLFHLQFKHRNGVKESA